MADKDFNRILLKELIDTANNFNKGLINQEEMEKYGNTMVIRGYIPLLEKMGIIMSLLTEYQYSDVNSAEIQMAELYKNLFFRVLLEEYAFINCDKKDLLTYENYDLLYPIFAPFILGFCQQDYETLISMLHDSINMYYNSRISEAVDNFANEDIKKGIDANSELLKELQDNKDMIKDLNNILSMNDPYTKRVADELKEIALNK